MAAADGTHGKNRVFWLNRTAGRLRYIRWANDNGEKGGRHLGFERPKLVENKTTPGFSVEKIQNKFALKVVQNGLITLKDVRLPEENHLQAGKSFRDTARVLRQTRYMVGWEATGCQMGAFEHTLKYAQERLQFGRPIGSFQLIQDLLAKMLANVTACQCLVVRTGQLDDQGKLTDAQAALSKAFTTAKCRETVAWGREIFGGNGVSINYNIGRFFTDAEALISYEGTSQMQSLILGKAITGLSAFVKPLHNQKTKQSVNRGYWPMSSTLTLENVLYEKKGAIAYVTVNRPKVLNALNQKTWENLRSAFEDARDDTAIRGAILTGGGDKAFIAGADISELATITAVEAEKSSNYGQEVLNLIENLGKPVIAVVNGFALGGGCETAMACTIRVAAEDAKFGQPEVTLGIIPGGGGTQRLPRLVGKGRALQLILSGGMINAQEAYRIGLVSYVNGTIRSLHEFAVSHKISLS